MYEILKTAILYTDMNKHETLIEDFREALERNEVSNQRWAKKRTCIALGHVCTADVLNGCGLDRQEMGRVDHGRVL